MWLLQVKHPIIVVLNKLNKHISYKARGVWFLTILLLSSFVVKAQELSDEWLMRINNRVVTLDEYRYLQENCAKNDNRFSEDFLSQFTDFLLLSSEAKTLQLDTLPAYRQAMKTYQDDCDKSAVWASTSLQQAKEMSEPQMNLSLLLIKLPQHHSSFQQKQVVALMDSLHARLQHGASFQEVVEKHSFYKEPLLVDKTQLSKEVLAVLDSLNEGDYSSPFFEPQGICMVKLHRRNIREQKISQQKLDSLLAIRVEEIKSELGFACDEIAKKELFSKKSTDKVLFRIGDTSYGMAHFSRFAAQSPMTIQRQWEAFVRWAVMDNYFNRLHQSPGYRFNLQQKSDSLLVSIYQQTLATPMPTDDELRRYFQEHQKQYVWKEKRFKGIVLQSADKKLLKSVRKWLKKLPYEEWQDALKMVINKDEVRVLSTQQLFARGDNPFVDELVYKCDEADANPLFPYVDVLGKRLKKPDGFNLVKDSVLNDYLKEKHRVLMAKLRASARIEFNEEVLKTVNSLNPIN